MLASFPSKPTVLDTCKKRKRSLTTLSSSVPPKGTRRSRCSQQLTQIMPVFHLRVMRWVLRHHEFNGEIRRSVKEANLVMFSVHKLPARPYRTALTSFSMSSSDVNGCTAHKFNKASAAKQF
jgi:hypothetical protein